MGTSRSESTKSTPGSLNSKESDGAGSVKRKMERNGEDDKNPPRRVRTHGNPVPSSYCHLCGRRKHLVTCNNIRSGKCLKSICDSCFASHGWDIIRAVTEGTWTCTHCRGCCPPTARCASYQLAVDKRRERNQRARESEKHFHDDSK